MPDASPPVSPLTRAPTETPLMSLYRQALGPLGIERNIRVFSVFEATGRTRPGWNSAAAFLTLHWMVFYRLWRPAALYAVLAAILWGLFLAVDAATMPTLASVRWWLLLAFVVVGTLLPGLYGDILLYAQTELRVHNAIAASQNLTQARALLARRAGTGKRMGWQALAHLLLLALGGMVTLVSMAPDKQPQLTSRQPEPTMATPILPRPAPILPLNAPATGAITPAPAAPPAPSAPPPTTAIGGQQPPIISGPAQAAQPAPVAPELPPPVDKSVISPPAAPRPEHTTATPAANPVNSTVAAEPVPRRPGKVAVNKPAPAPEPVALPKPRAKVYSSQDASQPTAPRPAPTAEPIRAPAPSKTPGKTPGKIPAKLAVAAPPAKETPPPPDKATGRFFIHAGTFSVASNAEKVHARIEMAGLPATLQNFTNADKNLIRVRVGPFGSRAEADRAAAKLRSMHLDAMIYGR